MKPIPALRLEDIRKSFGSTLVLKGITFDIAEGEILAILGPSGCGKSTLLMIIAGLEKPDRGDIFWREEKINSMAPHRREFGLMFQDFVLFPHLNVQRNVAFGLEMAGVPTREIRGRAGKVLSLVGLAGFDQRDVNSLSGGEQQRVALARALAPQPKLLMLDEPLGSVDRTLRERLINDLRQILQEVKQTAIYVTHDQEEAFTIADRVVLMRAGQVEQIGTPQEIYRNPRTLFAARFLGLTNLLSADIVSRDGKSYANTSIGSFPFAGEFSGRAALLIRPDSVRLDIGGESALAGKMVRKIFRGNICQAEVQIGNETFTFHFLSNVDLPGEGAQITVSFDPDEALLVLSE